MGGKSATANIKQQQYLAKKRAEDAQLAEGKHTGEQPKQNATTNTNAEAEAKKGLIPLLQEEIKKKEQLRDLSANEDEIRTINNEIAALQEKLKVMQMTNEEYLKYRNANSGIEPIPLVDEIFNITALTENKDAGLAIIDQAYQELATKGEQMAELAVEQQTKINDIAEMMNQALAAGITSSLNELANVIAGVEDANAGTVVKALLSPLADACITAGVLIMTTGKAIESLKAALMGFFGVGAIAAGAILVGIGVAAKAGLASIGKNAGRSSAGAGYNTSFTGGYGVSGGVNPFSYTQEQGSMVLTSTLKGQDLLLSIQRTEANNKR
jgi:predicted transcriptional regulator